MKLLILAIIVIVIVQFLKAALPGLRSSRKRRTTNRTNPHLQNTAPQAGKATVIGESGAWLNLRETLLERRLPVHNPEDIHPLLLKLKDWYSGSVADFHKEVSIYIRTINERIAALRAEKGFLRSLVNWFKILGHRRKISELSGLEERYAEILSENIRILEGTLHSPELTGAKAELEVIWRLRSLPGGYTVFNNVQLNSRRYIKFNDGPLKSAQLDHVVLSPAGVFVIETKCWSRQFSESGHYHNPFDQVQRARYLCWDLLKAEYGKLPVRAIILTAGSLPAAPPDSYTKVLHSKDLTGYITWFNKQELSPDVLRDVARYLTARVVNSPYSDDGLADLNPVDLLNSAVFDKMRAEAEQASTPKKPAPQGELIPTDPPPLKPEEDYRFMPPELRKEYEDRLQKRIQGKPDLSNNLNEVPPSSSVKTGETPKDLKYMPPEIRARFEGDSSAD